MGLPLTALFLESVMTFFVHKKAFLMSRILEIYKSLLPKDVSENYQSTRLQCKLASYYGSSITIQPQRGQGMSSIVFSSSLTIADAKIRLMPRVILWH
jgi:hypothetical protein